MRKPTNDTQRNASHIFDGFSRLSHLVYLKYKTANPINGSIIACIVPDMSTNITGFGKNI
jgi:hypothetical protein